MWRRDLRKFRKGRIQIAIFSTAKSNKKQERRYTFKSREAKGTTKKTDNLLGIHFLHTLYTYPIHRSCVYENIFVF